jgi:hypothetical protein
MMSYRAVPVWLISIALQACAMSAASLADTPDPLKSWNDRSSKAAIESFVDGVTRKGGPDFVAAAQRIVVFDNDGTLWCEKPMYVQVQFVIDRVKQLAPKHPEWKNEEPFRSLLAGDMAAVLKSGEAGQLKMVMATHAGITVEEFEAVVTKFLATAKHPRFERPYTELCYQPMLEVLDYLRAHDFQTFIVSGGGVEFMRPFTGRVYGVPPQQVVGSSIKTKFELQGEKPVLIRLPEVNFIDDGPGKPVGIWRDIGRVPIMAFGNSDGDLEMLQYTTMRKGARLGMIVHHDDAEREYAYDRESSVGRLDKALDQAEERGWHVISMKHEWATIFPPSVDPGNSPK